MSDILLIDGDIIRYRCAFAAEKTHYLVTQIFEGYQQYHEFDTAKEAKEYIETWEPEQANTWIRKETRPVEFALQATKTTMEAILARFDNPLYRLCLSGTTNFRDSVATTKKYKGDRPPKPKHYKAVGQYLEEQYGAKYTYGIEADDAIALDAASLGESVVIVSTDKDLRQIPGRHYDWTTGELGRVSRREAAFNFCRQILTGDPTDNIPGLEGVGPVKADQILDGAQNSVELMERVRSAYRDYGNARGWSEDKSVGYFIEQATLVKIGARFDDNA